MKKTGIFYGSTTGTTAEVAGRIAKALGVAGADVHDVANTAPSSMGDYELIVIGSPTWGSGDVQDDFYDFLDGTSALDLSGHKIALFGCGDETMTDTFCSAIGDIYERLKDCGAEFIGQFDVDGYSFHHSAALVDGRYVGLLLDEVNHPELTDGRITRWAGQLKAQA